MARPNAVWLGRWRDMILSKHGPRDPGAKLVALAVGKFVNIATMATYVSAATLAESTGLNERSARKHIDSLLAAGWLTARALRKTRGWKLREFTPQIPAGVPANSSGTQAKPDAPEEISRVPEVSSPWTGRNFPMDRKKRPTNSGRKNSEEEPGYGPGKCSENFEQETDRRHAINSAAGLLLGRRVKKAPPPTPQELEARKAEQLAAIRAKGVAV